MTLPPAARAAAAVLLLGGLAAITRVSSWRKPLGTDTGQYLYIGDLVLDGQTPYVDAVNNKGPVTYLLFALIRLGAGTSSTAVRLSLLVFAVAAALALGAYIAHFAGRSAGILAAVTFALFAGLPGLQGDDPNTEQYGVAFMVGGLWLATRPGTWWALGAGAAVAAAALMNPALVVAAPFVAFELWRTQDDRVGRRLGRIGLGFLGGVALAAPVVAWMLLAGAFDDMWEQVVEVARRASNASFGSGGARTRELADYREGALAVPERGLWLVGLAGLLVACTSHRLRRVAVPMILWVAVAWARVKGATYEFPHHYYPVLPALAAGIALGVARVWELLPAGRSAVRWGIAVVALAVPLWVWVGDNEREALQVAPGKRWGPEGDKFALAYPIADFVRDHTTPDEQILVVGTDPEVYWLAERRANGPVFDVFPILKRDRKWFRLRILDFIRNPPAAIVAMPDAELADPLFPDFFDLGVYPPAFEVGGARVWLRKK